MNVTRKDKQFLEMCVTNAKIFSTCIKKQYMAILVDENNYIVGIGYNGGPSKMLHCNEGGCDRAKECSPSGSSYDNCISVHAEQNALLHSDYSAKPSKLYVNGPPCFTCAKLIANSTVSTVYYLRDDSYEQFGYVRDFLSSADVELVEVELGG